MKVEYEFTLERTEINVVRWIRRFTPTLRKKNVNVGIETLEPVTLRKILLCGT